MESTKSLKVIRLRESSLRSSRTRKLQRIGITARPTKESPSTAKTGRSITDLSLKVLANAIDDWTHGPPLAKVKALVDHWRHRRAMRGSAGLSQSNEKREAMIDHIYLPVSDLERSSEFYKKVLEPLGIDMPYKFDQLHGFAINSNPGFWLKNGEVAKDLYVAFTAKSADAVRASYKAAIDAGATSNKEPSLRPEWRADYFAANIGDPDGYNSEIAYKPWLYK